ncbi:GntR family transcriptional regulator [Novosphingobium sp. BL-52-GroH]|uniref:GntR family transcriptional regulator n=1 Tax=Novosphingobium sp. BL-52-GroH TaxID=3349877 RepID=UPI00384DCA6D
MTAVKSVASTARRGAPGQLARGAAIPLYHQIYLTLRDEITRGDRPFGTAVPTEMELADDYRVSRITARRALDELATGGFVERRRRLGTRVIFRAGTKPIEANIDQAVESLIAFGQNTAVKVLEVTTEPAVGAIAEKLGLVDGEPAIRAVRLRSNRNGPLGLIVSHMRAGLGVSVTPQRLTEQPILSLLRDAGVKIGGAVQTIEAMVADPEMAGQLQCESRAAVLHVERLVENSSGVTVLVTNAYYRADRYRITLDMHEQGQISPTYG